MHLTTSLTLLALSLDVALSIPHLRHTHEKRVDYSVPANFDWKTAADWKNLNYGNGAPAQASPKEQPVQPVAQAAAPSPVPEKPKTEQKNTQTSQKQDTSSNDNAPATNAGGSKRGLAYNYESPSLDPFKPYASKSLSWAWNWASSPFHLNGLPLNYCPTLHSLKPDVLKTWDADSKKAVSSAGGKDVYFLGFNEPDIADQANMSPGAAAGAWKQYFGPLTGQGGVKLGSPQVSNGVGTNPATGQAYGLEWLKQFFGACGGCKIDFVVVHWYGCTNGCSVDTDVQALKDFVKKAVDFANGKKVWITELATHLPDQAGFMAKALPFLDGEPGVERYAYYMVKEGSLMQGGGLSEAGKKYVGA